MAPNIKTVVLSLLDCGGFSRALAPAAEVVVKNHHKNCELSSGSFRPCNGFCTKTVIFFFLYFSGFITLFARPGPVCWILNSKKVFTTLV
jgi:hypothetical protein